MPTDYACQAAAEQAAQAVTPVRALLVPARRPAPRHQDDVSPVIQAYLGTSPSADPEPEDWDAPFPEPVGGPMGAAALLTFLDGLRADLSGALVDWYSAVVVQFPQTLGAPPGETPGLPPARLPNGWQSLADLQRGAQDVLTVLAGHDRGGAIGPAELNWRLALVEDVLTGALRRMGVPDEMSLGCSAELSDAAGSLFGLGRRTARADSSRGV